MSTCASSINVCRMRVAKLDATGVPLPGSDNLYVSDALIKADVGLTISAGNRIEQRNGCGAICLTYEERDRVVGSTLGLELCQLDAELIGMLTGARVLMRDGEAVGLDVTDPADDHGVSVEMWTMAWDDEEQLVVGGKLAYYRMGFPRLRSVLGNHTLEQAVLRVPVTGKGNANANFYDGPANDWPDAPILGPYAVFLDDEDGMPDAACGYQTLLAS